ncbi:MAG TPA: dihydroxyacetone kinase subunit L [Candidatus Bariatricus faecipullorum]|nr:dihydroxyacetone kinase subunit L [Candidatus Bariatricus faecipullorum]
MNSQKVVEILHAVSKKIEEEKDFLTELDNVIGDGDHGINMARGFQKVEEKLDTLQTTDIGNILKTTGMTLVSTVGGASGPLYGTAFMKAGMVVAGKEELTLDDFLACMDAAAEGVKMRGKSTQGEKTMLDSMIPALEAMKKAKEEGQDTPAVLQKGTEAAKEGVEYTKTIIATKGRASYVGERSIGHQDPGATSFTDILETICNCVSA